MFAPIEVFSLKLYKNEDIDGSNIHDNTILFPSVFIVL